MIWRRRDSRTLHFNNTVMNISDFYLGMMGYYRGHCYYLDRLVQTHKQLSYFTPLERGYKFCLATHEALGSCYPLRTRRLSLAESKTLVEPSDIR